VLLSCLVILWESVVAKHLSTLENENIKQITNSSKCYQSANLVKS
ncbi:uncharacterized protein METZ01_LOCUS405163, partial [marine metagenome]